MKYSLKQVIQLQLHRCDLLFERSEAAGHGAPQTIRIHAFQYLAAGKIRKVARTRPLASFLK
ncbi:MAG: hypothetical protein ABSF64_07640 [Bryobacteraceae bacterium]